MIIRSDIKSILNFRHNIEKYGFIWIEFGNPHPCVQPPSTRLWLQNARHLLTRKKTGRHWRDVLGIACIHHPKLKDCDIALILLRPWAHRRHSGRVCTISVECEVLVRKQGLGGRSSWRTSQVGHRTRVFGDPYSLEIS
jgi:hypothetical protein